MKKILFIISLLFSVTVLLNSCSTEPSETERSEMLYQCPMKCEGINTYSQAVSCPICKMDLTPMDTPEVSSKSELILPTSIFNLTSKWNTKNDESISLTTLKGEVLVVVMIYTKCQAACPRLVADMRNIHDKVDDNAVRYVLVSIDPENDTPETLREFAIKNQLDTEQWIFLQGTIEDTRELSNVLAVKYKKISPLDFSHSNIISVFDKEGVLRHQQEGLGVDNEVIVGEILELTE